MTEFVSGIKSIPQNDERIFGMLSDLSNLEKIKDRIPQDKIKDFEFDRDSCSFSVSPVGKITFQIVDREPNKTMKFETTNSPLPLYLWIQLKNLSLIKTEEELRDWVRNYARSIPEDERESFLEQMFQTVDGDYI